MTESRKTRILFVDDDPMLLASTRRQLSRKMPDCDLAFFERAKDALADIQACTPGIVLSDVRMPEMDGAEFLEEVAKLSPGVIRLAWTGQSEADQLVRVFDIAHKVFGKPCPTDSLRNLIATVVEFTRENKTSGSNENMSDSELEQLQTRLSEFEEYSILPAVTRE